MFSITARVASLFLLMLLTSLAVPDEAELEGPSAAVDPAVLEALQTSPDVRVIVSLEEPDVPDIDVDIMQANASERQANVLAAVAPSDFQLTWQYEVTPTLAGRITLNGVEQLSKHEDVARIYIPPVFRIDLEESVPLVRAPEVHTAGVTGDGVQVAVLDTGIDSDHPDLADDISGQKCWLPVGGPCPNGQQSQGGPGSAEDDEGHGTHVSGIITSSGAVAPQGTAPGAQVFAFKVCNAAGQCDFENVLAALNDIIANHLGQFAALNMSFSDGPFFPGDCDTSYPDLANALAFVRSNGTLPFASSGNLASKNGMRPPACIGPVVSVGAVYDANFTTQTWASPNPDCTDAPVAPDDVGCGSNSSATLDLLGPSALITSSHLNGQTLTIRGTSQASPHAVAVAALLEDALPLLTADDVELRLKRTGKLDVDDLNDTDSSTRRVTPRVDARVALPTVTDDALDHDSDGCSNGEEFGSAASSGGLRNPLNFWDFFDVPAAPTYQRDKAITVADITSVVARFGASRPGGAPDEATALAEALAPAGPPGSPAAYHAGYDRTRVVTPSTATQLGKPNGSVSVEDITLVAGQFGASCTAPP